MPLAGSKTKDTKHLPQADERRCKCLLNCIPAIVVLWRSAEGELGVEAGRPAEQLAAAEEDLAAQAARLRDRLPAPVELGVLHQGQDSMDQSEL